MKKIQAASFWLATLAAMMIADITVAQLPYYGVRGIAVSSDGDFATLSELTENAGTLLISSPVDITGNLDATSLTLDTALAVAEGGTGATTASAARTNLGAVAGPGSSSNTGVALWNGTGGDTLSDSLLTVDGSGNLRGIGFVQPGYGTAASPAIQFALDQNTGFYGGASDTYGFSAGGSSVYDYGVSMALTHDFTGSIDVSGSGKFGGNLEVNGGDIGSTTDPDLFGVGNGAATINGTLDVNGKLTVAQSAFEAALFTRSGANSCGFTVGGTSTANQTSFGNSSSNYFFVGKQGGADNYIAIDTNEMNTTADIVWGWTSSNTNPEAAADTTIERSTAGVVKVTDVLALPVRSTAPGTSDLATTEAGFFHKGGVLYIAYNNGGTMAYNTVVADLTAGTSTPP